MHYKQNAVVIYNTDQQIQSLLEPQNCKIYIYDRALFVLKDPGWGPQFIQS